ncbi:MAG: [ribosomal protein S5]-alanine N-acetyltransferase [Solirubrobacteraceae bacterium]|nr:[ribosomal protein S5]-alanine N-acetyltransferase [Solirubrobacteraceae bacterium]
MSVARTDGASVVLRPIARDVAAALRDGATPAGVAFADGYPTQFSLEVMDLLCGPRASDGGARFEPCFVVRREDGAVVGEIGYGFDAASATAQLGYAIVEPCWGRGYATDALRALVAHLRADPHVRRITAQTLVGHGASRRVMEKAGMRLCDERLGEVDGELVELVVYEVGEAYAADVAPAARDVRAAGRRSWVGGYAPRGCVLRPGRCMPSNSRGSSISAATPTST